MAVGTSTDVAICSNALLRLGGRPFNSFAEGDTGDANLDHVRLAANLWPGVRRSVLRSATWNCAIKRVLLSPDATSPAFGYSYQFQRPSDWLRTLFVGRDECERLDYRTEGSRFLSDASALPLRYVFDNENPTTWDASLVAAVEMAMAQAMCYAVTGSTSLRDTLSQELRALLAQARNTDAQDDPAETLGDVSPLLASRFGGYAGSVR